MEVYVNNVLKSFEFHVYRELAFLTKMKMRLEEEWNFDGGQTRPMELQVTK